MSNLNFSHYIAPIIRYDTIRKKADEFRDLYWENKSCPVDILHIVEFDLKLEIRPIPGLKRAGDIDSFIMGDFSGIVVDEEEYMDDRYLNRIRYSIAHEIGHFVLHQDIYKKCGFENLSDENEWIEIFQALPQEQYDWFEQQAYEFAGRLLVPVADIKHEVMNLQVKIERIKKEYPDIENTKLAEYIAPLIAKRFEVSANVVSKRITIEKILEANFN